MTTRFARYLIIAGLLPPVAIGLALLLIPDVVTRTGDAGTFVDANVAPGGFGSNTMTSIHTSDGSFLVTGVFPSAQRGQALVVEDSTHDGLRLCVPGKPNICAQLASPYAGRMQSVAPAPLGLSHGLREICTFVAIFWFIAGLLALFVCIVSESGDEDHPGGNEPLDES